MRGRRQADEPDRHPQIRRAHREDNRHHAQRADEHRRLASRANRPAPLYQIRREPTAPDAAHLRREIDDDERRPQSAQSDAVGLVQKLRQPEEEEPPDGVCEELADGEGPRLPVTQQTRPRNLRRGLFGVTPYIGQLRTRQTRVLFRSAVEREPEDEPDEADRARQDERPTPTVGVGYPRYC